MGFLSSLGNSLGIGAGAAQPMSQAVMGFDAVPMGQAALKGKPAPTVSRVLSGFGQGLGGMGQQGGGEQIPALPDHGDPLSFLRSLGFLDGNHLGRLGQP